MILNDLYLEGEFQNAFHKEQIYMKETIDS